MIDSDKNALRKLNAAGPIRHFHSKTPGHDTVIGLGKLIHLQIVGRIPGIIVYAALPIRIGNKQAVAPIPAGRVADQPETETALPGRRVLVLTRNPCGMCIGYILDVDEIDRIADRAVPCHEMKRRSGLYDWVPAAALLTGEQEQDTT